MAQPGRHDPVPAPREGSSSHFALLFSPVDVRPALQALAAFRSEIDQILFHPVEDTVRSVKLAWWADEIGRLGIGTPRHPVTRRLQADLPAGGHELLLEFLDSTSAWLEPVGTHGHALESYFEISGAPLAELASRLPGTTAPEIQASLAAQARHLGSGIRATALARLALVAPRIVNRFCQPGSDPADLISRSRKFASSRFAEGFDNFPASECARQRGLLVLARLYQRLNEKLSASASGQRIELKTIIKLWTAWRTAQSSARAEARYRKEMSTNGH